MDQSVEHRDSFRLPFTSKVICHVDTIDKNYKCDIEIILEGKHSQLSIKNLSGRIIRNDDDGVAVRFDERLEWFALVPLYFHKLREECA
jgi:hypothetical protein